MQGRDYQILHIDKTVEAVSEYRKIIAQLPTGGGKTVEFSLIAQRYWRNTGKSVLILVHREELMYQAAKTLKDITDVTAYLVTSKTKKYHISRAYIGMVESTIPRLHMIDNIGLVIIDECHIANFNKIHNIFLEELIIGFSATPISSSKKEPLNKYYRNIIAGPQISELIKMGYLAQNITRCPKNVVDATKLEINKLKGDFDEGKMAIEYKKPKHITNVIEYYYKFCKGQKTIVFNVNIEHSKQVTECFQQCGFNAKHLDSNSSDRKEILQWFKETEDAILCNVMIATVGFDEPTIKNVICNFSTLSLVKWIQTSGRGGRMIDDDFINKYQKDYSYQLKHKLHFNIIDMGGNAIRHGDWSDNRDWEYIFDNPELPGDGVAPVKTCPKCEALVHTAATVCGMITAENEICDYEFIRKQTPEEKIAGELIIITKNIDIPSLIEKTSKKHEYFLLYHLAEDIVTKLFTKFPDPSETLLNKAFASYYDLLIDWWKKSMANKPGNMSDITYSAYHIKRARAYFNNLIKKRQPSLQLGDELINENA